MIIIDAKDAIVGRCATVAAKKALLGEEVAVINCSEAVISGQRKRIIEEWRQRYLQGVPRKGPFLHRQPDRFVRRIIRGMLPYKNPRGAEAFKRIKCYVRDPGMDGARLDVARSAKLPTMKFMTVGALCKALGGKDGKE